MKRQGSKETSSSQAESNGKLVKSKPAEAAMPKQAAAADAASAPSADDVRRRAYEIFLGRQSTGAPGNADSDWQRAERELRKR